MASILFNLKNSFLNNGKITTGIRAEHAKLESPAASAPYELNKFEKRLLVWSGKYKNVQDVPHHVQQSVVERARSIMRIRISNYTMLSTVLGCILVVFYGKKAAENGDSITKYNLEWHQRYNEEHQD